MQQLKKKPDWVDDSPCDLSKEEMDLLIALAKEARKHPERYKYTRKDLGF